jgi:hypothetical protein
MDIERAVAFVEAQGEAPQVALARYAVGRIGAEEVAQAISVRQRDDGSWSGIDHDMPAAVSSISQTWIGLQWLIWLDAPEGDTLVERTVDFLRAAQHPQGYWDEPDEIVQHHPPPWMLPGNPENQVWLTSAVMCKLKELGRDDGVNRAGALDFLRAAWQSEKGYFHEGGHPHWMTLPLLHGSERDDDRAIAAGCRDWLAHLVEERLIDPYDYAAVAYAALLTNDDVLFRLCMESIETFQKADGGMTTQYGDQHRVNGTVETLYLLKRASEADDPMWGPPGFEAE